ncbi:DUF4097 family beta strand repeat-containing protein [Streptomyces sp. NPDC048606]|uniref:DUF4097 family beta strand repeat-containing protein n=1 Tax=Streptomyces sp. NPDC048606 TaxID=3154726 RepID=UPI00342A9D07
MQFTTTTVDAAATADAAAVVTAVLEVAAGRVRFVAVGRDEVSVEVLPADASKGRDVKAAERVGVEYADGILSVRAEKSGKGLFGEDAGEVEVTVHLPAGSRVEARTASAEVRGVGRLGEVVVESAHGRVDLEEVAGARVGLEAGDIRIGRLDGPATLTTRHGDLHVAEAVRGAVNLRTEHGAITVGAAAGVSATLDAGTSYGRVHNALANTTGSGAALDIHATTAYGDITAHTL